MPKRSTAIPVVDVEPLVSAGVGDPDAVAAQIGAACRAHGFFYVVGHGVDQRLQARLEQVGREFFALDVEQKQQIGMAHGGRAWRGWFPVGAELTSGRPDQKEGVYFGAELGDDHPQVRAGVPLFGRNLFPDGIDGFRETVLAYIDAMTALGHALMEGIARSLGLDAGYFRERYTADPLVLFRIFHYPPLPAAAATGGGRGDEVDVWSVGEHTDYGLLTILKQDRSGGLEINSPDGWIDAPPVDGSFVCNLGDMLDRMTGGRYRSTPHRVRNRGDRGRLSFPFFFDPSFDAEVRPIDPDAPVDDDARERWDRRSVHAFDGTYGKYLVRKVARVFPQLGDEVL